MNIVALHGLPTSPALWARLSTPMRTPTLQGTLAAQVDAVLPLVTPDTILLGHDMGGVVAAMVALRAKVRHVVLTGTALGPYWAVVRATAAPGLWRPFYQLHGGRHFVAGAVAPALRAEALRVFPGADPVMMRALALSMRPPGDLGRRIAVRTPVSLIWGTRDRWYPPVVARAVARTTSGTITWVEGGHFVMWEAPEAFDAALGAVLARASA